MPADERNIVKWHCFDGLPLAEIARRLGWSPDTVERSFRRSIKALKRRLPAAGK
ncbi:MAG TPA: sigma factor-like helix-turn-helix DNA-binding protein [Pirellulales bacterium]|nr:sigma factor-like helix-turn-helix DNA-binding protein [Pirellulales bacterium]